MSHQHGLPPKEAAEGPYRRCQSRAEDDSGWLDHCRLVLFRTVQRRAHTRQQRQSRGQNVRVVAVSITGSSLPSQHPPTVFLRATLFGSGFVVPAITNQSVPNHNHFRSSKFPNCPARPSMPILSETPSHNPNPSSTDLHFPQQSPNNHIHPSLINVPIESHFPSFKSNQVAVKEKQGVVTIEGVWKRESELCVQTTK